MSSFLGLSEGGTGVAGHEEGTSASCLSDLVDVLQVS